MWRHKSIDEKDLQIPSLSHQNTTKILNEWLALCCEVYNAVLDERKSAYRMGGKSISYLHQCAELPDCKQVRPELAEVHSQVLQNVVKRVDQAFQAFFRQVKEGQNPGFPRFKSRFRLTR